MKGLELLKKLKGDEFDYKQDEGGQDKYLLINIKTGSIVWIWGHYDYPDRKVAQILKRLRGE